VSRLPDVLSPPFRGFFLGRAISMLGSAMTPVTLALSVLNASGQPTDLGIVMASQVLPQLVLLLAGGAIGDRFPRRAVLWLSNLGAGVTQAAVAILLIAGHYNLAAVAGLSAGNSAISAFSSPALSGVLPELVEPAGIQRANSLLASSQNAAKIFGPTAGGLLVVTVGGGWAIAVDALSYLVAAVFFARLPATRLPAPRLPAPRPAGQPSRAGASRPGLIADISEGWREYRAIGWLMAMSVPYFFLNMVNVGPWQILGPELTRQHGSEAAWGVVLSVRAIGLLAMSLAMYRLVLKRPLRDSAVIGLLGTLPLLGLGLAAGLPALAACAFTGALGFSAAGIAFDSVLATHIRPDLLSRISSIDQLLSAIGVPIGELLTGPAASHFGARTVTLCCGVIYGLATLAPLASRSVRSLGNLSEP